MKIIFDKKIPYLTDFFQATGFYAEGLDEQAITTEKLRTAEVLFTRTRTRCNAQLLDNTGIKAIFTATIGTDHIDLDYCQKKGIAVHNSQGCNSWAVVQYVLFAMTLYARKVEKMIKELRVGIVGHGHIGEMLATVLKIIGVDYLLCDPYKKGEQFQTLAKVATQADVLTLHTPYTETGDYPTQGFITKEILRAMPSNALLINSARGGLVDESCLLQLVKEGKMHAVLDCWNNEPEVIQALLKSSLLSTPHIAGYSQEGKLWGTQMALEQFFDGYGWKKKPVEAFFGKIHLEKLETQTQFEQELYKLERFSSKFRANSSNFIFLRNTYQPRADFYVTALTSVIENFKKIN